MKNTETVIKTIKQVLKEGNSTTNQHIKQRFIDIHVNTNLNSMVEFILSNGENAPFDWDDVNNYFSFPEYIGDFANFEGGTEEERDEEVERLQTLIDEIEDFKTNSPNYEEKIQEEIDELNDLESEPQDIFEWWSVSNFLCEKLKELGHPTIESENIWGRCTTGQAILLDYSITQICANMGILKGQESSWA